MQFLLAGDSYAKFGGLPLCEKQLNFFQFIVFTEVFPRMSKPLWKMHQFCLGGRKKE